jgi:uncharacterized membrane protein
MGRRHGQGELMRIVTIAATVGAALNGGVFFAFSTFVMTALRRLAPHDGLTAMQAINRAAPSPPFMTALFGTAALCVVVAIDAVRELDASGSAERIAAAVAYLVAIVTTVMYHVPRNNALDRLDPKSPSAEASWSSYARDWTRWNHVRTVACLSSSTLFALGLVRV